MFYQHVYKPTLKSTCVYNWPGQDKTSYFNLTLFVYQSSFNVDICVSCCYDHLPLNKTNLNMPMLKCMSLRHVCISAYSKSDKSFSLENKLQRLENIQLHEFVAIVLRNP